MIVEKIVETKRCECGCGECPARGKRFIHGHHAKGAGNGRWKGGRRTVDGYPQLWIPSHPRAVLGYIPEHVHKAEQALGTHLPSGAEVHHVNELRTDNRNCNLVICHDHAYHCLLHKRMKAYKASGNPLAGFCRFCKMWGVDMAKDQRGTSYHKACQAKYDKDKNARRKNLRECSKTN